jgi:hypothetical protein
LLAHHPPANRRPWESVRHWRARVGGASSSPDWHRTMRSSTTRGPSANTLSKCGCRPANRTTELLKVDVTHPRRVRASPALTFRPLFRFQGTATRPPRGRSGRIRSAGAGAGCPRPTRRSPCGAKNECSDPTTERQRDGGKLRARARRHGPAGASPSTTTRWRCFLPRWTSR